MSVSLPTLGTSGWVKDVATKADYVLSCFLSTNRSQSVLHREENTSLQYLLKKFANDMVGLETELLRVLNNKLQVAFGESARAIVEIIPIEDKPDQFSIRFLGIVYDDKHKEYTVAKLVQFQDSRILNIANINNG